MTAKYTSDKKALFDLAILVSEVIFRMGASYGSNHDFKRDYGKALDIATWFHEGGGDVI